MKENVGVKSILGVITSVFMYLAGCFNELLVILAVFMIMDYPLGILVAFKKKKQFDKDLAIWGAIKKLLYAGVLIMGFSADFIIIYLANNAGIVLPVKSLFGVATTVYLLGTEGFSNIRNFMLLGLPAPKILLQFFGLIKDQASKIVPMPEPKTIKE
jgi:phage-related holin